MVIRLMKIQQAKDLGVSDADILESIHRNEPDYQDAIGKGRQAGIGDTDILDRILVKQQRGLLRDLGTQALTRSVSGILGMPRQIGELGQFGADLVSNPKDTMEGLFRGFANQMGLPVDAEVPKGKEPAKTFLGRFGQTLTGERVREQSMNEYLFGQEAADRIKDVTGIKYLQKGLKKAGEIASDIWSVAGPFGPVRSFKEFPNSKEVRDILSNKLNVDLDPQTAPGRLLGTFLETVGENAFLGPVGALTMGEAVTLGNAAREAGMPEAVAIPLELGWLFARPFRPPAKQRLEEGPKISKSQLDDLKIDRVTREQFAEQSKLADEIKSGLESDLALKEARITGLEQQSEGMSQEELLRQQALEAQTAKLAEFEKRTSEKLQDFSVPVEASQIVEAIKNEAVEPILNTLGPGTDVEIGLTRVKDAISENYVRDRAIASNFYEEARFTLGDRQGNWRNTVSALDKLIEKYDQVGIQGVGRAAVEAAALDLRAAINDGLRINDSILRKQHLNSLFDFEFPDPAAKKKAASVFSNVRKAFVRDINRNIRNTSKEAYGNFRKAETKHAENAQRYGKDAVQKLQNDQSVLDSRSALTNAEDIGSLKRAIGPNSAFNVVIDRLVLEQLVAKDLSTIYRADLNLIRKRLEPRSLRVLDELSNLTDSMGVSAKNLDLQRIVLDDIVNAHVSGARPAIAMKLMQTPDGVRIARSALGRTRTGRTALENVENILVSDVFKSLLKDGAIDVAKASEVLKNTKLMRAVELMNPQAATLLKELPDFIAKTADSLQSVETLKALHAETAAAVKEVQAAQRIYDATNKARATDVTKFEKAQANRLLNRAKKAEADARRAELAKAKEVGPLKEALNETKDFAGAFMILKALGLPMTYKMAIAIKGIHLGARGLARVLKHREVPRLLKIIKTRSPNRAAALKMLSKIAEQELERD